MGVALGRRRVSRDDRIHLETADPTRPIPFLEATAMTPFTSSIRSTTRRLHAPGLTLLLAWIEVVVALAGAFLIVNERVVRES